MLFQQGTVADTEKTQRGGAKDILSQWRSVGLCRPGRKQNLPPPISLFAAPRKKWTRIQTVVFTIRIFIEIRLKRNNFINVQKEDKIAPQAKKIFLNK